MTAETLILRSLFGASVLACGLMLVAMVTTKPTSAPATTAHTVAATTLAASADHTRTVG